MKYSGRTTAFAHKRSNWEIMDSNSVDCIQSRVVFEVQWTNCPVEVENESNFGGIMLWVMIITILNGMVTNKGKIILQ